MGTAVNPTLIYLGQIIYLVFTIYVWLIVARVLLSWINPNPYSPVMRFLGKISDPVLNKARRLFPLTLGGFDFSPILAIMVIHLTGVVLGQWLMQIGQGMPASVVVPILAVSLMNFISSIVWLLIVLMGIRFIVALVQPSPYNILVRIIYGITEPLLSPLRRFFPPLGRGLDLRPVIFLLALFFLQWVVIKSSYIGIRPWFSGLAGAAAV